MAPTLTVCTKQWLAGVSSDLPSTRGEGGGAVDGRSAVVQVQVDGERIQGLLLHSTSRSSTVMIVTSRSRKIARELKYSNDGEMDDRYAEKGREINN